MSKPAINQTIGGYEFAWVEGVTIKVNRIRVHVADGRVTGEILIKNEKATLYPQTQINFSADRTRAGLVKGLAERYPDHNWIGIIDQLCYHVQEKAREGEPVTELWTNQDIKPPEYLVYPYVMKNQPNVLFGPPESGKTQFAMILTMAAMLPWAGNPLGMRVPEKPYSPLWLDYEADRDTTLWNFTRITHGIKQVGDLGLPYRRCRMPLADEVEQVATHMDKIGANFVIIDSIAKASGGDLLKDESPTRFFTALDQLKCTSLILAHTSKGEDGKKSIYGNVFFTAYARSIWEVKASRDGDTLNIGLWDSKANFRGKMEPMAYSLDYDDEHIFVNVADIKDVEDFMQHLSLSARITEALKDGSKSPKELKDILSDVSGNVFYAELARMVKKNKLVKMGAGKDLKYGLSYQEK